MGTRNSSIEFLRCLLMFGICFLHSITQGGYNQAWIANIFGTCVVGFVFISGWYGIRFSVRKIILLWGIAIWASFVFAVYDKLMTGAALIPVLWGVISDTWFLHAYVLLMLMSPIVNAAVEHLPWMSFLPFLFGVFGWGFARKFPLVGHYIPTTVGLTSFSGITLCGIYLAARLMRKYNLFQWVSVRLCWTVIFITSVACACGGGGYNSPFSLLLSIAVFRLFMNVHLGESVEHMTLMLAPSMFFVYAVHGHKFFYKMDAGSLGALEGWMVDSWHLPIAIAWMLMAVGIFAVAIICDIPRRWLYAKLTHK